MLPPVAAVASAAGVSDVFETKHAYCLPLITRYNWELDFEVLKVGVAELEKERRRPNFGNAGAVNNLLATAALRMEARTKSLPPAQRIDAQPLPEDFLSEAPGAAGSAADLFADLIGCHDMLRKLQEWEATIKISKAQGADPIKAGLEMNFVFVGSPGLYDWHGFNHPYAAWGGLYILEKASGEQLLNCALHNLYVTCTAPHAHKATTLSCGIRLFT